MNAVYVRSDFESEFIRTFYFKPQSPVFYAAGQFTQLTLPHPHSDERGIKHWFTLSSSPNDELLAITTKFMPDLGSTFKHALLRLKSGHNVMLDEPMGDFVLPKLLQTPLIFVAGGIGITPFRSMFRWLSSSGEKRPISLLYGVRDEDEIIFQQDIEAAGIHATIVVGEPSNEWGGERGRLTAEMILGLKHPTNESLIYLSGPEPMIESLMNSLKQNGIKQDHIVTDFFPGYQHI